MNIKKNDIVTLNFLPKNSSNTFVVDTVEVDSVLLTHPLLLKGMLLRANKDTVNTVNSNIKDSSERAIDYANQNRKHLDYNTCKDLDALGVYFAFTRNLSPKQKQMLAGVCGTIASDKFAGDLREAMNFVTKNSTMLDDFNLMWFNNFKGLFTGQQQITSEKQRSAIFNIAGYVLAELENPTAKTRK